MRCDKVTHLLGAILLRCCAAAVVSPNTAGAVKCSESNRELQIELCLKAISLQSIIIVDAIFFFLLHFSFLYSIYIRYYLMTLEWSADREKANPKWTGVRKRFINNNKKNGETYESDRNSFSIIKYSMAAVNIANLINVKNVKTTELS